MSNTDYTAGALSPIEQQAFDRPPPDFSHIENEALRRAFESLGCAQHSKVIVATYQETKITRKKIDSMEEMMQKEKAANEEMRKKFARTEGAVWRAVRWTAGTMVIGFIGILKFIFPFLFPHLFNK